MEQQPIKLPFTQQMQLKETHLRGTYLSICCDYERVMAEIITICECPTQTKEERDIYNDNKIRPLTMGKKLGRLMKSLKPFPLYYKISQPEFLIIKKLISLRNMLAHGYSDFDDNNADSSFIDFDYLDDRYKPKKTRINPKAFLLELEEYRKGIMALMQLSINILNVRNPV